MKIWGNWGLGVTVFLILFVISNLVFLFVISSENFDMVEENYYDKGLNYQDKIDLKYSSRIERNKDRLYELRLELEQDLKQFDKSNKETAQSESALQLLESRLTTLQGQLEKRGKGYSES